MMNGRLTAARHTVMRGIYNLPLTLTLSPKGRGEASAVTLCAVADEEDLETCVFTKRTHCFLGDFSTYYPRHEEVMAEILRRIRWVRFPKRTHREGVKWGWKVKIGREKAEIGGEKDEERRSACGPHALQYRGK